MRTRGNRGCGVYIRVFTHRLLRSSFLWFTFRILEGSPKKELLRSLWVITGAYRIASKNAEEQSLHGLPGEGPRCCCPGPAADSGV